MCLQRVPGSRRISKVSAAMESFVAALPVRRTRSENVTSPHGQVNRMGDGKLRRNDPVMGRRWNHVTDEATLRQRSAIKHFPNVPLCSAKNTLRCMCYSSSAAWGRPPRLCPKHYTVPCQLFYDTTTYSNKRKNARLHATWHASATRRSSGAIAAQGGKVGWDCGLGRRLRFALRNSEDTAIDSSSSLATTWLLSLRKASSSCLSSFLRRRRISGVRPDSTDAVGSYRCMPRIPDDLSNFLLSRMGKQLSLALRYWRSRIPAVASGRRPSLKSADNRSVYSISASVHPPDRQLRLDDVVVCSLGLRTEATPSEARDGV
ncbi:hypothetical protein H310_02907 [Aphanomyces invadans]|uniref:Uncharacterized protein n=1 Tax=Aphanomyces invadans TaxID=157072 RepID=A0A024ULK8_9STRA|nr:hypothetical protein H310_02907 [Aphanomyces invadans]ETW06742.1 hypothetical protein H310_02907 [Aphanomyces invadans]|eukprot:XP_008864817.1 hypothetical protein H310_02907 [Aphanomyces invadans]